MDTNQVRYYSDEDFIDDSFQDQNTDDLSEYRLKNVTRDKEEAIRDLENWKDYKCSDPENYVPPNRSDEMRETEYDEFNGFQKRIENFNESCQIFKKNYIESFYYAILNGAYFKLKGEGATCTEDTEELKSVLGAGFFLFSLSKKA